MKISIPLTCDTENSLPSAEIEFTPSEKEVSIKITDSRREVWVKIADLRKLLLLITE